MTTTRRTSRLGVARSAPRAFTLVELLIVISIIAVALAAILPAFSRIIESNNYSGAVNAVSATLSRAAASGRDGGVVFLFNPHTRRTMLQQVEVWNPDATLYDPSVGPGSLARIPAVAYRPVPGVAPVELPAGAGVFALSFSHDDAQMDTTASQQPWRFWFERESAFRDVQPTGRRRIEVNSWLFPRSDIQFYLRDYNPTVPSDPNRPEVNANSRPGANPNYFLNAETFIVRFNARGEALGSGALIGGVRDAYLEFPGEPLATVAASGANWNPPRGERDDLFDPDVYDDGAGQRQPTFNPEVQLRPVDQLAIVDLDRLANETGVRKPWFVRADPSNQPPPPPDKSGPNFQANPTASSGVIWRLNRWIDDNAQVIGFGRYAGQVVKR